MKKLIIAAFAVACAAVAQAATVQWGSGALYTAADANGGWSSTMVNTAGALVTMNIYMVDESTYTTVSAMSQENMYKWAAGQTATYTAQNKNPSTSAIIGAATVSDSTLAGSTTYYSILTAEYTDATLEKDFYMAAAVTATTPASGQKNVQNIFGGAAALATGGVRDWQPIPEPTSGLLMLLGMAGLALRRKQK